MYNKYLKYKKKYKLLRNNFLNFNNINELYDNWNQHKNLKNIYFTNNCMSCEYKNYTIKSIEMELNTEPSCKIILADTNKYLHIYNNGEFNLKVFNETGDKDICYYKPEIKNCLFSKS